MTDSEVAAAQADAAALKREISKLDDPALDLLFRRARTHNGWLDKPVTDDDLRRLHDLMRFGPTSANSQPARFVFVRSQEGKEKLMPALSPGNQEKTRTAPCCVIIAHDVAFHTLLPRLFPHKDMTGPYRDNPAHAEHTAFRNGSLQGAYLILAARALGFDTGAMSGFNNAVVDEAFFAGTTIKSNFLCNIGYGDPDKIFGRLDRLSFDEACTLA